MPAIGSKFDLLTKRNIHTTICVVVKERGAKRPPRRRRGIQRRPSSVLAETNHLKLRVSLTSAEGA